MKVFINPGHAPEGYPDPGAVNYSTGLRESDVVDNVGFLLSRYLLDAGIEAEVLQSDSLEEVCAAANDSDADIFISIHCNSAYNQEASGTETWYCYGSEDGKELAELINDEIVCSVGTEYRGVKCARPGVNGLYVLTNTDMPAVLVELAFISNADDEQLLADRQHDFAVAIARAVTDYFN